MAGSSGAAGKNYKELGQPMLMDLVKLYWQICLLKRSPENTPYSVGLFVSFLFLFFIIIVMQWSMVGTTPALSLQQLLMAGLLLCASYIVYTFFLLAIFKLQKRLIQTLSSLFAAHIIIHLFAIPLLVVTFLLAGKTTPEILATIILVFYLAMTIALTIWQLVVTVYIYKSALTTDNLAAILATVGLYAVGILAVSAVR